MMHQPIDDDTLTAVVAYGTPRTGIWCDACNTPAAIEVDAHALTTEGVTHLGHYRACTRCAGQD